MQLLEVLRNTSIDINGTHLQFDSKGNPNVGYDIIEWDWNASTLDFVVVGSFKEKLSINKTLLKWHTANSEVMYAIKKTDTVWYMHILVVKSHITLFWFWFL